MGEPDVISYMTSFLKEYNYPLIHSLTVEEISNVFHISNRCFLISWILKLMDDEIYSPVLEEKGCDKAFLGNILFSHGFCSDEEKMGFFNGKLDISDQLRILYRILKFVGNLKKSPTENNNNNISLDSLYMLKNINLNIIPGFGDIKPLTEVEKATKMEDIQQEIKQLQEKVNEIDVTEQNTGVFMKVSEDILDSLKDNLKQFDRIVKAIDKDKSRAVRSDYNIDPKSADLLESCNKNLSLFEQYIKDLNTINSCDIDKTPDLKDDISPLINLLAEQI